MTTVIHTGASMHALLITTSKVLQRATSLSAAFVWNIIKHSMNTYVILMQQTMFQCALYCFQYAKKNSEYETQSPRNETVEMTSIS